MRLLRSIAAVALLLAALLGASLPAAGQPDPTDVDRIFEEPLTRTTYIQYSPDPATGTSEYLDGLAQLAATYPDVVEVTPIGDLIGRPGLTSVGGREIPVIVITDESVPDEDKVDLYVSMSIHGPERAGLEGSVRFMEDIARGWYAERDGGEPYLLDNGDPERPYFVEMPASEALRRARLVFVELNPDGWAAGDVFTTNPGPGYKRGNDTLYPGQVTGPLCCVDLNRQWPTQGWHNDSGIQYETLSQPEAQAGYDLVTEYLGIPEGAADLHGENEDDVLLAIMFPAGQFDPRQLARQVELAEAIKFNVNQDVAPGAEELVGSGVVQPAEYHTAYDAIGYDDSGFMGDWLVQQGVLEMDHEYVFSNIAPNNVFVPGLEQLHVDTTRALLKATIVTTIVADDIGYEADLDGAVGYVVNPEVLTEAGAQVPPPFGFAQRPYESTPMQWFEDVAPYATAPVEPVGADAVAAGDLDGLSTLVVTDRVQPTASTGEDGAVAPVDRAAFWQRVRAFAEAGGNVVLTDAALQGLVDLGLASDGDVVRYGDEAGRLTEYDREHELLAGVTGVVGQTYFEVPLGFPFGEGEAPVWSVDTAVWEAAGGTTAATSAGGGTALGTLPVGEGRITVFGAVLPTASQEFPHTQGLADYAVTYAGNAILVNAVRWAQVPFPAEEPPQPPATPPGPDVEIDVVRAGGAGRVETAAAVAREAFPDGADVAYVATAESFADALAGGPAAALEDGPVLLTDPRTLSAATDVELRRLGVDRIVVLGGAAAVADEVVAALQGIAPVERRAGADRYATAAATSSAALPDGADVAYVATGADFADALAGGAAAARDGAPVLLTRPGDLPPVTRDELERLGLDRIVVLGGSAAVSEDVAEDLRAVAPVERIEGATRYETAAAVAAGFEGAGGATVHVATGERFPDALAAVPAAARAGGPIVLTTPDALPDASRDALSRLAPARVVVLGGRAAVSDAVVENLRTSG